MKIHRHKWKKTGGANYTCPLQFEFKCQCGAVKWVEEDIGIPTKILTDIEKKYYELLFAVARKFPDETRHQTALRYINEQEKIDASPDKNASAPKCECQKEVSKTKSNKK